MSLGIYSSPNPSSIFSIDGTFTNPIRMSFNGTTGTTKIFKYWLRNSNDETSFTDITITPVSLDIPNLVDGTNGFGWKLIAGDTLPTEDAWDDVDYGDPITMADIGDPDTEDGETYTYLPFYVRVEVPRGSEISTYQNVTIRVEALENPF